ncbi:hypothetical protein ACQPVP_10940 [Clostridium nigeriense]
MNWNEKYQYFFIDEYNEKLYYMTLDKNSKYLQKLANFDNDYMI